MFSSNNLFQFINYHLSTLSYIVVSWQGRDTQRNRVNYLLTQVVQSNEYYLLVSRCGCYVRS